jgi:hypothetical protein
MARELSYTVIPLENAKSINFYEVLETSWDTARWDTAGTEVMIHWEGRIPGSVAAILKITRGTTIAHNTMLAGIKSSTGQKNWAAQKPAPPKPKGK